MEKRRHPDQTEFDFAENEQTLPLGDVLDDLEDEFDHEDEEGTP